MNNVQDYLSQSAVYMSTFVKYWYFIFPLSLALMFGSRFMPKFIIIVTGFIIGFSFIFPYLLTINSFSSFITKTPSLSLPIQVIISIITAAAFWGLFKILGFLGGFLILGFLGKALFDMVDKNNVSLQNLVAKTSISPQTFGWLVFIGFGVIGGIIVLRKTDETIQFLSILVGSVLTAFYSLYYFEVLTKMGNMVSILKNASNNGKVKEIISLSSKEMSVFLVLTVVYIFIVYYLTSKAKNRKSNSAV